MELHLLRLIGRFQFSNSLRVVWDAVILSLLTLKLGKSFMMGNNRFFRQRKPIYTGFVSTVHITPAETILTPISRNFILNVWAALWTRDNISPWISNYWMLCHFLKLCNHPALTLKLAGPFKNLLNSSAFSHIIGPEMGSPSFFSV